MNNCFELKMKMQVVLKKGKKSFYISELCFKRMFGWKDFDEKVQFLVFVKRDFFPL